MSNEDLPSRLHQAMHQLPGFPDHDTAQERNSNKAGRDRAKRWNNHLNEAGRNRAARWNSNAAAAQRHGKPPRVFVGMQEFIARLVGQGE